jgi:hypothetical protein
LFCGTPLADRDGSPFSLDEMNKMLLKNKKTGDLIKINDLSALCDPFKSEVVGCNQSGEDDQLKGPHLKVDLVFPSDEVLPRCWTDSEYKSLPSPKRSESSI